MGEMFSLQLLLCAGIFTIYFLLPVFRDPKWLFYVIQSLCFCLVFLEGNIEWVTLFIIYILIEAIFQFQPYSYRFFIGYSFILLILLNIFEMKWIITSFIMISFIFFLSIVLNQYVSERNEQRDLYKQLLEEYRRLKRWNVQNEQVARLEERTRIAHDIHDSVGHKLTALLMQIEVLSLKNKIMDLSDVKKLAMESLDETRLAVKTLRYEDVTGISSVLQLIRKLESENHLLVKFTTKQGVLQSELTNEQSVVLYRSIQEGLTNTMKHGSSREVDVTLGCSAIGDLEWVISNPIVHPKPFDHGFGLTAMKERVEGQGGKLRIYQTDKKFMIEGSMPIKGNVG